jgi:hypothetical protein
LKIGVQGLSAAGLGDADAEPVRPDRDRVRDPHLVPERAAVGGSGLTLALFEHRTSAGQIVLERSEPLTAELYSQLLD